MTNGTGQRMIAGVNGRQWMRTDAANRCGAALAPINAPSRPGTGTNLSITATNNAPTARYRNIKAGTVPAGANAALLRGTAQRQSQRDSTAKTGKWQPHALLTTPKATVLHHEIVKCIISNYDTLVSQLFVHSPLETQMSQAA